MLPTTTARAAVLAAVALVCGLAVGSAPAHARTPPLADEHPLAGVVVAIDPGHQLGNSRHLRKVNRLVWAGIWKPCNTTGTATDRGYPEATFTWHLARALRTRLLALGATVRMSRTTNSVHDWGPCVDTRGRFGTRVHADVEISLHGDGAPAPVHGFVVIRPGLRRGLTDDILVSSHRLARSVHRGLVAAGLHPSTSYGGDGYDVRRDLGTLNMSDVPTVMVEMGNMRNHRDARCMTHAACRDRWAAGLMRGLRAYLVR